VPVTSNPSKIRTGQRPHDLAHAVGTVVKQKIPSPSRMSGAPVMTRGLTKLVGLADGVRLLDRGDGIGT